MKEGEKKKLMHKTAKKRRNCSQEGYGAKENKAVSIECGGRREKETDTQESEEDKKLVHKTA